MARLYAEAGIPVFPCFKDGKKPASPNGFKDSTTDLAIIDEWWQQEPEYNLAVCPDFAGWFVLDIDPGADRSIYEKLPATYRVRTPRGGTHDYYEGSGASTVSKIAQHVDTRGVGGYVLVPPSRVDGVEYTVEEDLDYHAVPAWITEKLSTSATIVAASVDKADLIENINRATTFLQREEPAVNSPGMGSDYRTYQVACTVRDFGISPETAFALMWEHWATRCEGQWTEDFIKLKIHNAYSYGQNEAGAFGVAPAKDVFAEAVKKLAPDPTKPSRFHFKDESEQDEAPDARWLIPELIVERSTILMYGARASYKSLLALDIMMGVAAMQETFGVMPLSGGPVFYGAHEGQGALRKHRRAWRIAKGIEGKVDFFLGNAPRIMNQEDIEEFGDQIEMRCDKLGKAPAMICLDTVAKCMLGMDENSVKDASIMIQFVESLVESFGCAVMAVHHSGTEKGRARGSTAFEAGFDTVLEVDRHEDTRAVQVKMHKQKEMAEKEDAWTFEGRIFGPSLSFQTTTKSEHKLLTGGGRKDDPLAPTIVGAALKKMNVFGEERAVETQVLAMELTPARENQSIEDHGKAMALTRRALNAAAKDRLVGYAIPQQKGYKWCLPAPTPDQ